MSTALSEYELEVLPELGAGYESEFEGDFESQQFFGALANLARRGVGWMTAPGSPQRQLALSVARRALNRGLPALGQLVARSGGVGNGAAGAALGSQAASWLDGLLPQQEYEAELELNPARRIYPDAMLEHLGHAAAETHSEAEAEALAGAMIPLAAASIPRRATPILLHATPGLVSGLSGVVHGLRGSPATRPLVRIVPAIVRSTATNIAQQASRGVPVSPQAAVRMLAQQTFRMLGSPQQSARAFRRSRALDGLFHRGYRAPCGNGCSCPTCAARESTFEFEAPPVQQCRALTAAESRIVRQARIEAIKLADTAASRLEAALAPGPRTKEAQKKAKETADLFTSIFCHGPGRLVDDKLSSGASVADRFRKVARELRGSAKGGRTITFRSCAGCGPGIEANNCCDVGERAHTCQNTTTCPHPTPNVITLCAPFWNPPPQRGLPPEGFRGGVILHEMLHILYTNFFHHHYPPHSRTTERRRNNAHCFRAFALRATGYGQDNDAILGCTGRPC
jgi:hypothetical protein